MHPEKRDQRLFLQDILGAKAKAVEIPWRRISGTRDRLSHGYYHIDLNVVWEIVELELEPLEAAVKNLMETMNS
ncbi:MAG: HepT-like ribonuclease domain-containing protein [Actinomycetota bacterium]